MISPEEEMKVFDLLFDKFLDIERAMGNDLNEKKVLDYVWISYLKSIGIRRVRADFKPNEDVYMSFDPGCDSPARILIPWDVFERILVVGLP